MNKVEIVKELLKHKPNIELRNKQDISPLLTAIVRKKPILVRLLLENGAELKFKSRN